MGCRKMSSHCFQDFLSTKKLGIKKRKQFCGTPCTLQNNFSVYRGCQIQWRLLTFGWKQHCCCMICIMIKSFASPSIAVSYMSEWMITAVPVLIISITEDRQTMFNQLDMKKSFLFLPQISYQHLKLDIFLKANAKEGADQ